MVSQWLKNDFPEFNLIICCENGEHADMNNSHVKYLASSIIASAALFGLSGCHIYGDASVYSSDQCESLRALYGNTAQRQYADTNTAASDFDRAQPNDLDINPRADLAVNRTEKSRSDIRAAYRAKGC